MSYPTSRAVVTRPKTEVSDPARERNLALGSAAWRVGPGSEELVYRKGDFFIGNITDGNAAGFRDDSHALICAGSRSGKGASYIVMNLLMYTGSAFVLDPKGENAMVTARRRSTGSAYSKAMGQRVRVIDPHGVAHTATDNFEDMKGRFNPLDLISIDSRDAIDIASLIAESLVEERDSVSDPFWPDAARGVIRDIALHVASSSDVKPGDRNLVTVRNFIVAGDEQLARIAKLASPDGAAISGLEFLFESMRRNRSFGGHVSRAGTMLQDMLAASPRTLVGILQTARTNTDFIASTGMAECLSSSNFALSDLKTDKRGMTIYLCLPQRYIGTHYRYLRMMTSLLVAEMERVRQQPACGLPVLMMLDEFPALRRMKVIESAAAQIAGFGVRMVLVVQTLAQLKDIYKDGWETLMASCGLKLFFGNDDHFTRDYVSKLIGETEVSRWTESQSSTQSESKGSSVSLSYPSPDSAHSYRVTGRSLGSNNSQSRGRTYGSSETIHRRPLLTPDEVGRLFGNRDDKTALGIVSGHQPLFLRRQIYHTARFLKSGYDPHPDHPHPLTLIQRAARDAREAQQAAELVQRRKQEALLLEAQRQREAEERRWRKLMTAQTPRSLPPPTKSKPLGKMFAAIGRFLRG